MKTYIAMRVDIYRPISEGPEFIATDPVSDGPELLQKYITHMKKDFIGVKVPMKDRLTWCRMPNGDLFLSNDGRSGWLITVIHPNPEFGRFMLGLQ